MKTKSCNCTLLSCEKVNTRDADNRFQLQPLPYPENALEPYMSEKTVKFHYGKHLPAYIENTNKLKAGTEFDEMPLIQIVKEASGGLFNNASQVFNHYFQFEALAPYNPAAEPGKHTLKMIEENFGSLEDFKERFSQTALKLFGSGYVWLAAAPNGKLEILPVSNAENPLTEGKIPVMNLDVWEHAYYLDVQNERAKYIENAMKIISWEAIEERVKKVKDLIGSKD